MAPRKKRKQLTPEQRQERLRAAHDTLTASVESLTTEEGWRALIRSRAWLRRYSLGNLLMIVAQNEHATDVRPYGEWKNVGRYVKRGERGIRIFAPVRYRVRGDDGEPVTDDDGNPRYTVRSFTVVSVFDVSQTDGEPLPDTDRATPRVLEGTAPPQMWDTIADQITRRGYTIERGDTAPANGWVNFETRTVRVREDVDDAQAVKTLVHELAHIACEHDTRDIRRATREVEAESVACLVTAMAGLDSLPYSVPYVAGWAKDAETARASADRVLTVADAIVSTLTATLPDTVAA
ncbi:ArdC-like ssDNA-binding domain-containing protein [Nocardiopsis quinghaiensis]|uniref:ArdC-like ssDNA-binding domain-containing protein n=1 Tax=Nocardiopsis quinghaiensis TaxID=464995 RepID=UPI001CC23826|nr:ArdC-like ssDNA-binding domain-containing protein [Nocardiopsis quinghaiensis]